MAMTAAVRGSLLPRLRPLGAERAAKVPMVTGHAQSEPNYGTARAPIAATSLTRSAGFPRASLAAAGPSSAVASKRADTVV